MSLAIATSARVVIPMVPQSWANWRGSSLRRDLARRAERDLAHMLGHSARNAAGWRLPVKCDPPARRYLAVEIHKCRPLYDEDGAVSCLKGLIDGCFRGIRHPPGPLAWDDSPAWLGLITAPIDMQRVVATESEERVVFTVHLVDPR